ncbi:MAG TPA: hypothetical protein GX697_06795 [Firmicutes bacterium]|nr:hypothetical protein [Bacillota bacterium]
MPAYNIRLKRLEVLGWIIAAILVLTLPGVYTLLQDTPKTNNESLLDEVYDYFISLEEYSFRTIEEGPGYSLTFEGLSRQNYLKGEIVGHNLHILCQNGLLFIKNDNERWEKAGDLGLDNLRAFIREPLFLIDSLRNKVPLISFERDNESGENNIYSATIETHKDELARYLFPGIEADLINSVMLSVSFESKEVKEINISLEMSEKEGSEPPSLTRKIVIKAGTDGEDSKFDTVI